MSSSTKLCLAGAFVSLGVNQRRICPSSKQCHAQTCISDNCTFDSTLEVRHPKAVEVLTKSWSFPSKHSFISCAPRCMQDACWIPYARAYSLGLYVDEGLFRSCRANNANNPLTILDPQVDKTLRFFFVGDKSSAHIVNGWERALVAALPRNDNYDYNIDRGLQQIAQFKKLIRSLGMKKNSVVLITMISSPEPGSTIVTYADSEKDELKLVGMIEGTELRYAFHNLYIADVSSSDYGLPRYASIGRKFRESCADNTSNTELKQ